MQAAIPIEIGEADEGLQLRTTTRNLSSSGAYCDIDAPIEEFTKLRIRIQLPAETPGDGEPYAIECTGVVVRHDAYETDTGEECHSVAIFFESLTARERETVDRFIARSLAGV